MTERSSWPPDEQYQHQYELRQKRAAWEAERKQRKEQEQRDRKRAELESYLRDRSREWSDTTGSAPSVAVLERWQHEFLDGKQLEAEAERAAKLAAAVEQYDF